MQLTEKPKVTQTATGLLTSPGCAFYYLREDVTVHIKEKLGKGGKVLRIAQDRVLCRPFACVAVRRQTNGTVKWIARGIALCSKKDNFCKIKGRSLAYKRLRLAETGEWVYGENELFQDKRLEAAIGKKHPSSRTTLPTEYEQKLLDDLRVREEV